MNDRIDKLLAFLQQSPDDLFLNHALALEYIKAGRESEAQQLFEKNLATNGEYVATYYHLGKLLERASQTTEAIALYEKGMQVARAVKDNHSYNELQAAYEDLADL